MGYSTEVIKRARERLAQVKADRESENRQHLQQAYARVPRLQEIDRQLRQTMALAAQAVFAKGGDARDAMEQVKQRNLGLQQERAELVTANFEEGFLDESPICDRCGGSGYIGSTMCECLTELCRQEQKKELSVLNVGKESFEQFRLDYYSQQIDPELGVSMRTVMEKTFRTCRSYALTFSEKSPNLLFSGGTGLGKTFLSACIARTVANNGYSVAYESAAHLFSRLERAKFGGDEEQRQNVLKYTACDLLIIDDLGTEMGGQFTTSALYTLVNDRILSGKPTIISTNLNTEELARRYSPQIASRLRGDYLRVAFVGEDIRIIKNRRL
ncbi:MAG: ATP-binding protein [Oscillospiraceae bacterium]|nr:ATP-binding protein [Oscillospiraceae bacterium]